MRSKKVIALLISLTLLVSIALPGTLAVSVDQVTSNGTIEVPTETTTPAPGTTESPAPEETEAPVETPTEGPSKTCTCNPQPAEGEAHKEDCPLYEAPKTLMTVTFDPAGGTETFPAQQFKPITSVPDDRQNYLVKNPGDPTAPEGRVFVGWYKVESDGSLELTPWDFADRIVTKTMTLKAVYADQKYTVKFEALPDLTITKSGGQDIDENQSFLFDVTGPNEYSKRVVINGSGSVTIKGLEIGTYTVTEVTGWSWRYTPENNGQTITLQPAERNEVTFENTRSSTKWLDGNAYSKNEFKNK